MRQNKQDVHCYEIIVIFALEICLEILLDLIISKLHSYVFLYQIKMMMKLILCFISLPAWYNEQAVWPVFSYW